MAAPSSIIYGQTISFFDPQYTIYYNISHFFQLKHFFGNMLFCKKAYLKKYGAYSDVGNKTPF